MLSGVAAGLFLAALLWMTPNRAGTPSPNALRVGWGRAVLALTAAHVALMGYEKWLAVEDWPGYLPPITLLSFIAAGVFLTLRSRSSKR